MNNENNQAGLHCVSGLNLLCMLYMHYPAAESLHIKDTAIAGNVTELRGVAICCNLESLMIIRVPFYSRLMKQVMTSSVLSYMYRN